MLTLKEWRRARGFSQDAMADLLEVHPNTYRAWEDNPGDIKISKCIQCAEILGVKLEDINFCN